MIRCAVVDDDPMARLVLERFIAEVPGMAVTAFCATAAEAAPIMDGGEVDLVFLDWDLPDASGLDLLRSRPSPPPTILVTAARDVVDEALEAGAIASLVKPLSYQRFAEVLEGVGYRTRGDSGAP